jgi:hypothetical protein
VRIFDWDKAAVLIAKLRSEFVIGCVQISPVEYDPLCMSPRSCTLYDGLRTVPHRIPVARHLASRTGYPWVVLLIDGGELVDIPCWLPAHKAPAKWHGPTAWPADALAELNRLLGK